MGIGKDEWGPAFSELADLAWKRLSWGDVEFDGKCPPTCADTLTEIEQEIADIWGWSALLWSRIRKLKEKVKNALSEDEEPKPERATPEDNPTAKEEKEIEEVESWKRLKVAACSGPGAAGSRHRIDIMREFLGHQQMDWDLWEAMKKESDAWRAEVIQLLKEVRKAQCHRSARHAGPEQ